ncbi:phosphoribosylaminoimidazole carboxylase [Streptococcus sp. X16XC17]|uniref:hypothetical protein n=1 Tax=unclassified Streptococcus TaxID=2608887 RepID=UPI00066FE030|nr:MULTISPECIES: hypothetical protein [unclassified Streptococcus]TCD45672.1 phosphoribosylaminoimidazole carboxylase [Streptococcus sp. X16XC17]
MIQIIVHAFANRSEGVVEVLYASTDSESIAEKMTDFKKEFPGDYLAIYDLPLDTNLAQLSYYPSVAISLDDFTD